MLFALAQGRGAGVTVGRQRGQLAQSLAFIRMLKVFFVGHAPPSTCNRECSIGSLGRGRRRAVFDIVHWGNWMTMPRIGLSERAYRTVNVGVTSHEYIKSC